MNKRIIQSECMDTHLDAVSKELMRQAMQCISTKGTFHLALSESSLLDSFYARLMCDPDMRMLPWEKICVRFFGDTTEDDSIQRAIEFHSGIPEDNVIASDSEVHIDCCLMACSDVEHFVNVICAQSTAFLILARDLDDTTQLALSDNSVAHVFCIESDTHD